MAQLKDTIINGNLTLTTPLSIAGGGTGVSTIEELKSLLGIDKIADFVIDQGKTSDGWYYRKWESGDAECWVRWSGTVSNYTSTVGLGPCVYGYTKTWNLPFTFTELYSKTATAQVGNGMCVITSGGLNDTTTKIAYHWASNVASGTSQVNIHIYGKWK